MKHHCDQNKVVQGNTPDWIVNKIKLGISKTQPRNKTSLIVSTRCDYSTHCYRVKGANDY
jgi:hypothetical protein